MNKTGLNNSKIIAAKIKILRITDKTKMDRIRTINKSESLEIQPLVNIIENKQLNLYGYPKR